MDIPKLRKRIAFVDVEASGLMAGAFPVEVAWITTSGNGEALLNPSGYWDETKWDADAEAMHGLSVQELRRKGRRPMVVAAALESSLAGKIAFSDSPDHDQAWLDMIHSAAGVPRTYSVETIGRLIGFLGLSPKRAYALFEEARATHPPRGRARSGAAYLSAVFEAALMESSR